MPYQFIRMIFLKMFGETIQRIESDSLQFRNSHDGGKTDTRVIWVLICSAVVMVIQNYVTPYNVEPIVVKILAKTVGDEQASDARDWFRHLDRFDQLAWFAVCAVSSYVLLPLLVIKFVFREPLKQFGTKLHGIFSSWWIYLIFISVMIPIVWIFSAESHFQQTYPFYRVYDSSDVNGKFLMWEILYALQFVALEFFFRGFMVHGLKHRFGIYSVFVMTVTYCMIHFGKPLPECLASIIAGIALGLMSLKTNSIWLGAALHISVAWGMDYCSLLRRGFLE